MEEEGALKIIPKWKASQITEIILEPEPEEEEVSLIRDHSGNGTRGGRCQIIISFKHLWPQLQLLYLIIDI